MATTDYYDGAHDALVEAMQEIKAAMVMGYADIKRSYYDTDTEYYREIAVRAVMDLHLSYEKDRRYVVGTMERATRETADA